MCAAPSGQLVPFGHEMLKYFLLDSHYKNLNHGSFGTYPSAVQIEQRKFQDETELSPDIFIRYKQPRYLDEARKAIAKLLNVPTNETVFVPNATTGVNTVLRNLVYVRDDVIVYFVTAYPACEKAILSLVETTPVQARRVEYDFPISHEEIVNRFLDVVRQAKGEGLNVRVALLDVVVSMPGVRFPFESLVKACQDEDILSCIDGAHGVGHVPLDLDALGADFFVSNCHKWLYTPRACAVFHVPARNQHLIRTTFPTSHGFVPQADVNSNAGLAGKITNPLPSLGEPKTQFEILFEFVGTVDYSPYLCVPAALKFREEICGGEVRIMEYCEKLAWEAGNLVAQILGTEVMCEPGVNPKTRTGQLRRCAFATVRLPLAVDDGRRRHASKTVSSYSVLSAEEAPVVARWMETVLAMEYNTLVLHLVHAGWIWARVSAQVYLEAKDFSWLAETLVQVCKRVAKGEATVVARKT